ncbi:ferredoxin [Streptomyces sp. NPDC001070]
MTWQIDVDAHTCIGTGSCAGIAPGHFELRDGTSCPLHPTAEPDELLIDAAESCPVEAITIRDASTGELIAPGE